MILANSLTDVTTEEQEIDPKEVRFRIDFVIVLILEIHLECALL